MDTVRLNTVEVPGARAERTEAAPARTRGFAAELSSAVGQVESLQAEADREAALVARGGGNLHELALVLEKADIAMRVVTKVRNKLVDAYQEIMRMTA